MKQKKLPQETLVVIFLYRDYCPQKKDLQNITFFNNFVSRKGGTLCHTTSAALAAIPAIKHLANTKT